MRYVPLFGFFVLTFAAGFIGSHYMPDAWFAALAKPSWNPPGQVFAPVWTTLYALIAVAGWRVWRVRMLPWARVALAAWVAQLVANGLWSWLFFGLHRIDWALCDIALVWLAIVAFIARCWARERVAAGLFVPYLLWVSFASALNFAIWRLNG